jgi:BirA family biotin operon repressor/biotin-[acetyl-CoA-carboxylase] ligase
MDEQGKQTGLLPYTPLTISSLLDTLIIGRHVQLHRQVGSTNDLARLAGQRGEPEGLVVLAEEQLAGRGRLGRRWVAPAGCCILCSVLLRPRFPVDRAFYLTIAASLAIYRACRKLMASGGHGSTPATAADVTIKWPNDVLVNARKVAGVLCESEFSGGKWSFSVVGFGINVNLSAEQLGQIHAPATSLSAELGRPVDRARLLASVLGELESLYLSLQSGQFGPVYAEWAAALETTGKRVRVQVHEPSGAVSLTGQAVRVEQDGALVLRLSNGTERRVLAADVLQPAKPATSGSGSTD